MLLECTPVGNWTDIHSQMVPWILQRYPKWSGWVPGHCYPREYAWAIQQMGSVKGRRILDAGGGASVLSAILSDWGASEIVVVDKEPKPYTDVRITSHVCDLQDTHLAPDSFDVIVSVSAIEHNPWDKQVLILQHLLDLVPSEGELIMTVPSVPTVQRAWHENYRNWGCVYFWTHAAAREMAHNLNKQALLETPLLPDDVYDREWVRIQQEALRLSPSLRIYPYQSMGLKWRRK